MSEEIYPRSPRETMAGWVHLPRFVDKIRLHLAERLPSDYQKAFTNGFDKAWCEAAGVDPQAFIEVVRGTVTDGEVFDWVRKNAKKTDADKAAFRDYIMSMGREGQVKEKLKQRKEEAGLSHRDDIECMVDFIDADEGRL